MDRPTIDDVRSRSPLLTVKYPDPAGDTDLEQVVNDAAALVSVLTGRVIGFTGEGLFGCTLEEVPAAMQPIALLAVARKAESYPVTDTAAAREAALAQASGGLSGFTAGPYSESYFGPSQAATARALDPDPELNGLLQALWTECVRLGWARVWDPNSPPAPAAAIQSFDWWPGLRGETLSWSGLSGPGHHTPDGF